MTFRRANRWHLAIAMMAGMVLLVLDVHSAFAQAAACQQLTRQLATLERNGDFRALNVSTQNARALQDQLQQDESTYVRGGCQAVQNSGQPLPAQCRTLAKRIIAGRRDANAYAQSIATGNAVAQQREQVLQQIARFGCGTRSQASVDAQQVQRPRNLFEQLFGPFTGGEGNIIQDQTGYGFYGDQPTVRTMCVRLSDGYYFPISYATLRDYIPNDAQACQAACPGANVDLYYYDNPGQEVEQMVNQQGQPYTSLASAFAYRKALDPNATCKPPAQATGKITLVTLADGQSRAMVEFNGEQFPLPEFDPRRRQAATAAPLEVAQVIDVPLPRPRPSDAPGEKGPQPIKPPVATADARIVEIAGKKVRIVGPDTPYGRPVGAGS